MKKTIKGNLAYFLDCSEDLATAWIILGNKMSKEIAEEMVNNIPDRFKKLTGNEISRYSEMEILELIIHESLLILDTRLGPLQYYARKRLLELHNNPKTYDSNTDTTLPPLNPAL